MRKKTTTIVGILGGIGCGKSTVARTFERFGAIVLDADEIAHEVSEQPEVVAKIVATFGTDVVDESGRIDRPELARRVFGPENAASRAQLERLIHPRVRQQLDHELEQARRARVSLVVLDIPLLPESRYRDECDVIVFVRVPFEVRLERVSERGWTEEELVTREASQMPIDEKASIAGIVVDNIDREAMTAEVERLCRAWVREGVSGEGHGESRQEEGHEEESR